MPTHSKQFDIELARHTADNCTESSLEAEGSADAKKKSLWLRIARHVVEKNKDVKQYVPS